MAAVKIFGAFFKMFKLKPFRLQKFLCPLFLLWSVGRAVGARQGFLLEPGNAVVV